MIIGRYLVETTFSLKDCGGHNLPVRIINRSAPRDLIDLLLEIDGTVVHGSLVGRVMSGSYSTYLQAICAWKDSTEKDENGTCRSSQRATNAEQQPRTVGLREPPMECPGPCLSPLSRPPYCDSCRFRHGPKVPYSVILLYLYPHPPHPQLLPTTLLPPSTTSESCLASCPSTHLYILRTLPPLPT